VKSLRKIAVVGMGLLGSSLTLAIMRTFSQVRVVGFSHRPSTRQKARALNVAEEITESLEQAVCNADMVVLATPICTFEELFRQMSKSLKDGCIVTDVGSTKRWPHRWAKKALGSKVFFVGSHPIAGSEKRGVEFARDDLFVNAKCIVTKTASTNNAAVETVKNFWVKIGCRVEIMTPAQHDKILGDVSHIPHITAAAIVNATSEKIINYAGKGFIDTTRIASGPENVWSDILITNPKNTVKGIDRVIRELEKLKAAIGSGDQKQIEKLLSKARQKRDKLIEYKMSRDELI